jgi:pimeloyl-ACP methyl ester carboxylesterase
MKNLKLIIVSLLIAICGTVNAQKGINYGSNNGKYVTAGNLKIYYEEYGTGIPLLMLHGGFSSISNFEKIIPEFAKRYRVIAIDLPGHGRTELPDSLSFQLLADYSSKIIDILKLDSVYVFGYSVGAVVALHLAADRSDKVKRTVALSGGLNMSGYMPENAYFLSNVTPEMCEAPQIKWWMDDYTAKSPARDNWKKFVTDFRKMFAVTSFIPEEKLKQIKSPVLILQGDHDAVKTEQGLYMSRLLKNCQFGAMPGATHFTISQNPELINKCSFDFFNN